MEIVYLDHAATSWPKPPAVVQAMQDAIVAYGANPGRGSHSLALRASKIIFEARLHLARLINVPNPNDIHFTLNATMALNLAIKGFVKAGDHVICTNFEHNSVRRPLEHLKHTKQIEVTYLQANLQGEIQLNQLEQAFQSNTVLVVCNHSSNLLGNILPLDQIASITREHGAKLLVDAAQTIGIFPIDITAQGIDMLAFPGHKGLLGPQGTGGLYIHPNIELEPLLHGGTGSQSEKIEQPDVRPDRYESGTLNTPGIAGLNEGVKFILEQGIEAIYEKEWTLSQYLMEQLEIIPHIRILGPVLGKPRTGVVSFVHPGIDPAQMAFLLDRHYRVAVRAGYHCTPLAHETVGTMDSGAVRASVGYSTTQKELDYFVSAVKQIIEDV